MDRNPSGQPFSNPEIEQGYQKHLLKFPDATRESFLQKRNAILSRSSSFGGSVKRVVKTLEGIMIPVSHLSFEDAATLNAESRRLST